MFDKILRSGKILRFSNCDPPIPVHAAPEENSATLKIVHAGGFVECYFMAVSAKMIMDKHPSSYLTRPDVFRRPWDSVVRPDETLFPGQKFFVVPRRTVRKLRKRIKKPVATSGILLIRSADDVPGEGRDRDEIMSSNGGSRGIMKRKKIKGGPKKHVRFMDAEKKPKTGPPSNVVEKQKSKGFKVVQLEGENSNVVRRSGTWQPSLAAVKESHGSNH